MPLLTVIVGTYNRISLLKRCLKSLLIRYPFKIEIYVIDAGSTDGSRQYLDKLQKTGSIKLIKQAGRVGQAKSINSVLRKISSKYFCWLSDDNEVKEGMLESAVSILAKNSDFGMVGLKVQDVAGPLIHTPYIGGISAAGVLTVNQGMLITNLTKKLGCFDETYPDYGMDTDLTTKVLLAGFKVVYTRKVAIRHYRDHQKFPGAFKRDDRKNRQLSSVKIYRNKYKELCDSYQSVNNVLLRKLLLLPDVCIDYFYKLLKKLEIRFEKIIGFNQHDFHNVLTARFISKLDLWYNRKNSYYLVQNIKN